MRHASIILALAHLAGCASAGDPAEGGSESAGIVDPPATGTQGSSTQDPAPPTTGGSSTGGEGLSAGETSTSGDAPTTGEPLGGSTTTGEPTTGDDPTTTTNATGGPPPEPPPWAPKPCPAIFAQDLLPTFELELSDSVLSAIKKEWSVADDNNLVEHPLKSFKYQDTVITNASIRLRGNSSHWPDQGKMQFEIAFHAFDKKGRFMGLKHLLFDAAEYNRSFLRDRLSLAILRDAGVAAPCANNARLMLNGKYYGLFTSIEKIDSEFLKRNFEDPEGNLYKRGGSKFGWTKKPNEKDPDLSDVKTLLAAKTVDELLAVMNGEQALLEWAAEAVIPDRDGAWAGGLNFYIYNDPLTGFNVIPWDLDDTLTRLPFDTDPYTYKKPAEVFHGRPFYDILTADPVWFDRYIDAVEHVVTTAYDVQVLQSRIDTWAAQIAEAAAEDPNKPFTTAEHLKRIKEKREYVAKRAEHLAAWLACWRNGGTKSNNGTCKPG